MHASWLGYGPTGFFTTPFTLPQGRGEVGFLWKGGGGKVMLNQGIPGSRPDKNMKTLENLLSIR